ncbi:MAG: hypothetical protein WC812_03120 [Candidatus Pacearchaeota archaeon]|jgi:hypothetical protein
MTEKIKCYRFTSSLSTDYFDPKTRRAISIISNEGEITTKREIAESQGKRMPFKKEKEFIGKLEVYADSTLFTLTSHLNYVPIE